MHRTTRRLALMMGSVACLALPGIAHANLFGTGNNGVWAEQQRFENDNSQGNGKSENTGQSGDTGSGGNAGWQGGSYQSAPQGRYQSQDNQVPEPQTLGLVAIGLLAAWAASRRRKD